MSIHHLYRQRNHRLQQLIRKTEAKIKQQKFHFFQTNLSQENLMAPCRANRAILVDVPLMRHHRFEDSLTVVVEVDDYD